MSLVSLHPPQTLLILLVSYICQVYSNCTEYNADGIDTLRIIAITIPKESNIGGTLLAAQEINANISILPQYDLDITVYNTERSGITALKHALNTITNTTDCLMMDNTTAISYPPIHTHTHIQLHTITYVCTTVPFLLGCPWSSLSIMTAASLNAFSYAQLSSSATSVVLSSTSDFSYFYRTVSNDLMQAQAIVNLCLHFEWTEISILHDHDSYGTYLSMEILELGLSVGIDARAVGYQREDSDSIVNAVESIKSLNTFITVLIVHGSELSEVFTALGDSELLGYPYFYIGSDAWMSENDIVSAGVQEYTQGYIGTVPWHPGSLSLEDYTSDAVRNIYSSTKDKYSKIVDLWNMQLEDDASVLYNVSVADNYAFYGWDSMYTLAYLLDSYDKQYSLSSLIQNTSAFSSLFMESIFNMTTGGLSFMGATGNVSFDENGDRTFGLYSYSYITANGSIQPFGYLFDTNSTFYDGEIYDTRIIWPSDFQTKFLIPSSSIIIIGEISTINTPIFIVVCILITISFILLFIYVGTTLVYRDKKLIKNASWKLNMIMCIGCILMYIAIILFGIDEQFSNINYPSLCNFRIWLAVIAFTVIFMPLFFKTYRISKIFTSWINSKALPDYKLYMAVGVCVAIDIFLLTIFTAIEPHDRIYFNAGTESIDSLQMIQYQYGSCAIESVGVEAGFLVVIGIWKLIQFGYGFYVALILARIGVRELMKYNETGQQVFSIVFTVIVLCIAIPLLFLLNDEWISGKFAVIAFATVVVCNVTLAANIVPRLWAVFLDDENRFEKNAQKEMRRRLNDKMKEFHNRERSQSTMNTGSSDIKPPMDFSSNTYVEEEKENLNSGDDNGVTLSIGNQGSADGDGGIVEQRAP